MTGTRTAEAHHAALMLIPDLWDANWHTGDDEIFYTHSSYEMTEQQIRHEAQLLGLGYHETDCVEEDGSRCITLQARGVFCGVLVTITAYQPLEVSA